MSSLRLTLPLALGLCALATGQSSERGQQPREPKPQWQRLLTGDDAKKAADLKKRIQELDDADKRDEALKLAKELLALRIEWQGEDHYEVRDARLLLADLERPPLTAVERKRLKEALELGREAVALFKKGQAAAASPKAEKSLALIEAVRGENHPDYATSLNNLAVLYESKGDYARAEPLYLKARDLRKKLLGENHPDYAASLDHLASLCTFKGDYAKAEPLFLEARDLTKKLLGENHPNYAIGLNNLAGLYYSNGDYTRAEPLYLEARDLTKKLLGENHPDYATSVNNLALLYKSKGDYARAEPLLLEARDLRKKLLGENHPNYAQSLSNLAGLYQLKGDYAKAEPLYLEARDLLKKLLGENHPSYATSLSSLASLYESKGDYAKAEQLYLEARDLRKKLLGENHPDYATSLNNLAGLYQSKGDYARAEPLLLEARDLRKKLLGENHSSYATSLHNLAGLYYLKGDYAKAEPLYLEARDLLKKLLGENHPNYATSLNSLALVYYSKGDYAKAEPLYLEARDLRKKFLGENHPDYAASLHHLALLYYSKGDYAKAEPLFLEARDLRKKLLGENHPHYATSLNHLAVLYQTKGDHAKAEPVLAASRSAFEMARLIHAHGLERAVGSEGQNPYSPHSAVLARLGKAREAFAALNLDLARATADELARRHDLALPPRQEQQQKQIAERLVPIDRRILYLLTQPKLDDGERKELEALQAEREGLKLELAKIAASFSQSQVESLERIQSSLAADQALLAWLDVTDTTGRLQEHWACVLRHTGDPIWTLLPGTGKDGDWTKDDVQLTFRLRHALRGSTTTADDIDALVAQVRTQRITSIEKHLAGVRRLLVVATNRMAGLPIELLAPKYRVEYVQSGTAMVRAAPKPRPAGDASLLAVGDPVLPQLVLGKERPLPPGGLLIQTVVKGGSAFQHLQSGDVLLTYGGADLSDVEGLAKAITTHAQAKTVPVKIWRETETGEAVTRTLDLAPGRLGITLATGSAREVLAARRKSDEQFAKLTRSGRVDPKTGEKQPWKELPGTAVELNRLKALFGDQADIFTRSEASEQKLDELHQANRLKNYRYLHFATHGLANDDKVLESFLVLAQDHLPKFEGKRGERPINGELSAYEMLDWKLDADLVTLSTCESALGRTAGGEGLLGFTQVLLAAGARSVCLSLWRIDDTATYLLMSRFYENLLGRREGLSGPMPKAAALREAKEWLKNLTADEVLAHARTLARGVSRGKGEVPPPELKPQDVAPQGNLKVKPYADPRYWAAFILVGAPD